MPTGITRTLGGNMLNEKEAQELHECIGLALLTIPDGETATRADLTRARELAAIVVSDATDDDRHCGYANYETFTIAVVVENDRQLIAEARTITLASLANRVYASETCDDVRKWVEERFTEWVTENQGHEDGIASTLLNSALSQVDWQELVAEWSETENV